MTSDELISKLDGIIPATSNGPYLYLGILVLVLLSILIWLFFRKKPSTTYRTEAILRLKNISSIASNKHLIRELHILLKDTAAYTFGSKVATITDATMWIKFLNQTSPHQIFSAREAELFASIYNDNEIETIHRQSLIESSTYWINHHKSHLTSREKNELFR